MSLFQRGLLSLFLLFVFFFLSGVIIYSNGTRHFLPPAKDHGEPEAPLFMTCNKIKSKAIKELLLT